MHLGMRPEIELERAEPANDVLRRIGAIDPDDELLGPAREDLFLGLEHGLALRQLVELRGIDGDRRGHALLGHVLAEQLARAVDEVAPPAVGVEADHVVRDQPFVNCAAGFAREHAPVVGLGPRDVHEMHERRVRATLAYQLRREVEVVVVEEHGRLGFAFELVEHRSREPVVYDHVAVPPRVVKGGVHPRCVGELPERMLDEPQHRVRNDVVVPVVRLRIVSDEMEPVGVLLHRLAGQRALSLRGRARDPGHVLVLEQAAQGRREPAAAALQGSVARDLHRSAVRADDQLPAHLRRGIRYAPAEPTATSAPDVSFPSSWLNSTSQSRNRRGVKKWRRTYSFPRSARCRASIGSRRISMHASAHSVDDSTSQPVFPSWIWATIPPTRPATVGRVFQSASVTVSPNPSLIDFWITAAEWTWKALTSTEPTLFRLERM